MVTHNQNLKLEITKLEHEKKRLMDVLAVHEMSCPKRRRHVTGRSDDADANADAILTELTQHRFEPVGFPETPHFDAIPTIKVEDLSSPIEEDIFLRPPDPIGCFGDGFPPPQTTLYNHHYHPNHHQVPGLHTFLGVKTLGHTYLDLDNRCLAL